MTKRRILVKQLTDAGFTSVGGTKHERFTNGARSVLMKRHNEIPDEIAQKILRQAGLH